MRKIVTFLLCFVLLCSLGCGDGRRINGSYHDTYGVFSLEKKDPEVCYTMIVGNVVWSVLLVETLIAPIYFIGWSLWEPVDSENCPYSSQN